MRSKRKNAAAVALGRRGGKRKVPKGFSQMAPEKRSAAGKKGAAARWGKEPG